MFSYNEKRVMKMEPVRGSRMQDPDSVIESGDNNSHASNGESENESNDGPKSKPNPAPNISLNFRDPKRYSTAMHRGRPMWRLLAAAAFGTLLQSGVLAYFWIVTFYPTLKDDSGSSFPIIGLGLSFSGTIFLVAGMFLCAKVVEQRTDEEKWEVKEGLKGTEFDVMWVQNRRSAATEYSSYIVFADKPHSVILTSHRNDEERKWQRDVIVVLGASTTTLGFIMQLFGLRMMHWSASVAQFGATLIMILIRALVRRHLADSPKQYKIPESYELDWAAMRFERHSDDLHSLFKCKSDETGTHEKCELWEDGCWNWSVSVDVEPAGKDDDGIINGFICPSHADLQGEAQLVLKTRERLGAMSSRIGPNWSGPAAQLATSLSCAIEQIMNSIYPSTSHLETMKYWTRTVLVSRGVDRVYFRLEFGDGKWKSVPKEIEAFLSLWLFQLSSKIEDSITNAQKAIRCIGPWIPEIHHDLVRWGRDKGDMSVYVVRELENAKDKDDM